MKFSEIVKQAMTLLHESQRITYRALKLEFDLNDEQLAALTEELIEAREVAVDKDGKLLVWVDKEQGAESVEHGAISEGGEQLQLPSRTSSSLRPAARAEGERRQLTVMFIDLVDSTTLSRQLDPEDYHARVRAYQSLCHQAIVRYDGYIAQYLGDGVLAYFGYPTAHEDDAARAVHSGLEILAAISEQGTQDRERHTQHALQVRIGIHTGPVVVAGIGSGARTEQLALGETPNIAARLQGLAAPNTMVVSAATRRLVAERFDALDMGAQQLKGVTTALHVYRVLGPSGVDHRLDVGVPMGWTPLVGRDEELALLTRRWEQATDGEGQAVLLCGEPGVGKSRLVRELRERVAADNALRMEFRCSPYYQNSAFHPVIEHLQRRLQWQTDDPVQTRTAKLQAALAQYHFPQADTLALFAALLSLPHPADAPPLNLSPQRQKQKTHEALIAWLVAEAEQQPVYCVWEDLHWADPSTLELLALLIEQLPTTRLFVLLTSRPEFTSPWGQHGHVSQLTLSRLGRRYVPQMIARATAGKALPAEVVQQIVAKTDGVPLFVEELTKMVLESGLLIEHATHYALRGPLPPLAIPSTLQDSLMARLDRLATTKEIAQWGATLGREFSYELLHVVSPLDPQTLQTGLQQLVATELIYQRGTPPQATYVFKHALIQDTAYQSLLKSTRQQLHQQIAHVLEERFPETKETQPELLAHHYTEAGLIEQAIPYWQQAGRRAAQRSANVEAVSHLRRGLALLETLPETPERSQHELALQATLGPVLMATKGYAASETGAAYTRAATLCQQLGETAQRFPALYGVWGFQIVRVDCQSARTLGKELLHLAELEHDPALLVVAHWALGATLFHMGEIEAARWHCEQSVAHYDAQQHRSLAIEYGNDPAMSALIYGAWALWLLGYPEQALRQSQASVAHARGLAHPFSLATALALATGVHYYRREWDQTQEQAEAAITLATEHGFPFWVAWCTICRGRSMLEHGCAAAGTDQMRWGIAEMRATGAEIMHSSFLCLLGEAYLKDGQVEEGLATVAEALAFVKRTEERFYEAELYRLKGELTLQKEARGLRLETSPPSSQASSPKSLIPSGAEQEAEECFLKAIAIAQQQQAKSLELRAVMSLARLWQQQGKQHEAHEMLAKIYSWFTEGFDTKDLQEAKMLIEELSHRAIEPLKA